MQDQIKKYLFELFGDIQETSHSQLGCGSWTEFCSDKFLIEAVKYGNQSSILIRAGLKSSGMCQKNWPVNFWLNNNLSRRKKHRIQQCLNFMLRNKKMGDCFGSIPGFDDLGRYTPYLVPQKKL